MLNIWMFIVILKNIYFLCHKRVGTQFKDILILFNLMYICDIGYTKGFFESINWDINHRPFIKGKNVTIYKQMIHTFPYLKLR